MAITWALLVSYFQLKEEEVSELLNTQEVKTLMQQYETNIQSKLNDWMSNCLEKEKVTDRVEYRELGLRAIE